jgi:hypothetical protein
MNHFGELAKFLLDINTVKSRQQAGTSPTKGHGFKSSLQKYTSIVRFTK